MKRMLLIAPDFACDYFPRESELAKLPSFAEKRSFLVPLHLATIAALTPDDVEVDIWDEPVHGRIDDSTEFPEYHLVGLTGYRFYLRRAKEIAKIFRQRGIPVVVGGSGVSSEPERYRDDFDVLFIGEAEITWPQFIADWKNGDFKKEYRQIAKPDLALSPLPCWDNIADQMKHYLVGAVQTSRGCPFNCDFCDVTYLFGRRIRNKPIDNVLQEVHSFERMGMRNIFFCDDNFIGNVRYAKDLLKELKSLNRTFPEPLGFTTQLSINLAKDDELLELFADSNFTLAFIGIESPNKEALQEINKPQNYRTDLMHDIKKVQSYGIPIKAAMMVGLDSDDKSIFEQQFSFLQEACTPNPSIHILKAAPGTKLWTRFHKERRLIAKSWDIGSINSNLKIPRTATNLIPKKMSRVELMEGYCNLLRKVRDWDNFAKRVKGFVSQVKRKPLAPPSNIKESVRAELKQFFLTSVDNKVKRAVFELTQYTSQHAPFMMKKVIGLIFQQYNEVILTQSMCEDIQRQIELERSGEIKLEIDQTDTFVPEGFNKPYQKLFPEIYKRVYIGLKDKARIDEVLVEIFTGLLIRWEPTFEQFEEYYRTYLFEITDHAIEKENNNVSSQSVSIGQAQEEMSDIPTQIGDEILKAVEQELRGIRFASSDDQATDIK